MGKGRYTIINERLFVDGSSHSEEPYASLCRKNREILRRFQSPQLCAAWSGGDGGRRFAADSAGEGRIRTAWLAAERDLHHSPLAGRRAEPPRPVRHEARSSGRIPRPVESDPYER